MQAYEARILMQENMLRIVRGAPLAKALALIEESAREGNPGVNLMHPSRPGEKDPLIGLSVLEEKMLVAELENLGYTVTRTDPDGSDQRDVGSFVVEWGNAKPASEPPPPRRLM